jgi:hypothetical protein
MTTMRRKRRGWPVLNPRQFLLLPPTLLQGQGLIIVMIRGLIRRPMVATTADIVPVSLRL